MKAVFVSISCLGGSDFYSENLNLVVPVVAGLALTVGAVAWRYCFGSKQSIVSAGNATLNSTDRVISSPVSSSIKEKEATGNLSSKAVAPALPSASKPAFDEINCSIAGLVECGSSFSFVGFESLTNKEKVYPADLVPLLGKFVPAGENKEQHIAKIMLRRAGQTPNLRFGYGGPAVPSAPTWIKQLSPIENDNTVRPFIKGSEVLDFVGDFHSAKFYATHPDA